MSADDYEEEAVDYFMGVMMEHFDGESVDYRYLCGHLRYASEEVMDYMNETYPIDFCYFFTKHSNIFKVDAYGNVSLHSSEQVEQKAVEYFKKVLQERYSKPVPYMCLRGHLGQATIDVVDYVKNTYPKSCFLQFFTNNKHAFQVDSNGNVSLRPNKPKKNPNNYIKNVVVPQSQAASNSSRSLPSADEEDRAVDYFKDILLNRYSKPVLYTNLLGHLGQATDDVTNYIRATYPRNEFLLFFTDNEDVFQVDANGYVSLHSNVHMEAKAVEYFETILLNRYSNPVFYKHLQGHLGQATDDIVDYMREEYPDHDFLSFFLNNSDTFQVDADGNVSLKPSEDFQSDVMPVQNFFQNVSDLCQAGASSCVAVQTTDEIEGRAVEYFEKVLSERYSEPVLYSSLQGHLGQATDDVIDYIRDRYPRADFLLFFTNNGDVFQVDAGGYVSLKSDVEKEAVEYFKTVLLNRYSVPVFFKHLRGHLGQATDDIIDYMREEYPDNDFLSFFTNNSDTFHVDSCDNVSLKRPNVKDATLVQHFSSSTSDLRQAAANVFVPLQTTNSLEERAAEYFKNILLERYSQPVLYKFLRGHLGQATDDIVDYIRDVYPKDSFLSFFGNHGNIFLVYSNGCVSLQPIVHCENSAVIYFRNILLDRYSKPVFYESLRGHLGQATSEIIDFMNNFYPGTQFLSFFIKNRNAFKVNRNHHVSAI